MTRLREPQPHSRSMTNLHQPVPPSSTTLPPKRHPTLAIYNQSCRAKQSESTGKAAGAVARPPFSAVGGPSRAPKAQITAYIMRGLAQQAQPLFPSHTHTVALLLRSCSVLVTPHKCQHSCFTCHCTSMGIDKHGLIIVSD